MTVNYHRLREQALVLAKESGIDATDFKCSDKWIFNFMKRNKLSVRKVTHARQADNKTAGEKAQIAQDYLDAIPGLTADKDETPVYIDMLSSSLPYILLETKSLMQITVVPLKLALLLCSVFVLPERC